MAEIGSLWIVGFLIGFVSLAIGLGIISLNSTEWYIQDIGYGLAAIGVGIVVAIFLVIVAKGSHEGV